VPTERIPVGVQEKIRLLEGEKARLAAQLHDAGDKLAKINGEWETRLRSTQLRHAQTTGELKGLKDSYQTQIRGLVAELRLKNEELKALQQPPTIYYPAPRRCW
jgi:hypothetical protein